MSLSKKNHKQEVFHQRYNAQYKVMTQTLLQEYWNDVQAKWYTIGKSQGGGTLLRISASWDKATMNVSKQEFHQTYYRAVDQAIALLACLEMLESKDVSRERERVVELVEKTCVQLVSKDGFGYGLEAGSKRSYIGLQRNRNFLLDGWVVLALLSCAQQGYQSLVSVADVYPQVTLHPNTELASLVVWSL